MKQIDIKDLTNEELQSNLMEKAESLAKLKLNHTVSALENPAQLKDLRKTVARLKTEIRKRQNN